MVPFVAGTIGFTEHLGLRLSYTYLRGVETTTEFGLPIGALLAINVQGHYRDDINLASAAPEFTWNLGAKLALAVAPQVNWVRSRGVVSFSTNNPAVLLVAPRSRNDDGFTFGGSARLVYSFGARAAVAVGYQYVDLEPSFGRTANVFSGGVQWKF
jgi:hypothetical protein